MDSFRPVKHDREAWSTEDARGLYPDVKLSFGLLMLSDGAGSSDSADSVMRHLQGLKVRAREIRGRKEARCYAIRSKGQCRSVEHLFFTFSADVQHLHRREGLITQGCLRLEESTRGITIFSLCTLVTFLLL